MRAMRESVRWFHVVACMVGLVACSYPPLAEPGDAQSSDVAPPPQFLSCVGLATMCGASGNDSCCDSPEVVGGSYDRSYDSANDANSGDTSFPATVSNFRLDKYEVTVGRFRAFVNAGMGTQSSPPMAMAGAHANIAGSGWDTSWSASLPADKDALIAAVKMCDSTYQTWTDTPAANEHRPMDCITWYEAMAFCVWDGGYLATEAEWNYAAAGGDKQRAYPWSNLAGSLTIDDSHASYYDGVNCVGDGMPGCAGTDVVAVGTKSAGDGLWHQSDLAGNVWEWTLDLYASYANPCTDCANLTVGSDRVIRGGGLSNGASDLRTGVRHNFTPSYRYYSVGVRCARSAQ